MAATLSKTIYRFAILVILFFLCSFCVAPAQAGTDWESEVLYFVLLDRFENGTTMNDFSVNPKNPHAFHGGDLQGLLQRLDYLQELGVTGIWLSPVYLNRPMPFYGQEAYHGYWPWDFYKVDPRFGNIFKLQELRRELRRRGMKLVLDMVVNHAGYDAPIVQKHPLFFHENPEIGDWNDQAQLESFGVYGLPDFASEKGVVQQFFHGVTRHWLKEVEPDGFRLDAVKHVPLEFWRTFNRRLSSSQGEKFLLLGEQLQGDPAVIARTMRLGGFSSLFDFPLHYTLIEVFARGGSCKALGLRFAQDFRYDHPNRMATFLDNHDVERFFTLCGKDYKKYRLALIQLLTARGIPTLCYGDETPLVSSTGVFGSNRPDMRFQTDSETFGLVKNLISIRKEHPSLQKGVQVQLGMSDTWYAFSRLLPDEATIVAINNSSRSAFLSLPLETPLREGTTLTDLLSLVEGKVRRGKLQVQLEPMSAAVFVVHPARPGGFSMAHYLAQEARRDPFVYGKVRTTFRLTSKPPASGSVFLIGGLPVLGAWDPEKSVPMKLDRKGNWVAVVDLPARAVTDFKFLVKSEGKVIWPDGWWNYDLEVPTGRRLSIDRAWKK